MAVARKLVKVVSLCGIALAPQAGHAYDVDVHYWFTYFAARVTGFSDEQAFRIARANQSVDNPDSDTNPVPDITHLNLSKQSEARTLFHAFLDDRGVNKIGLYSLHQVKGKTSRREFINRTAPGALYKSALAAIPRRARDLEAWARSHGNNPGILLHFVQDRYSHAGYGVKLGQAVGKTLPNIEPHVLVLPGGTLTDYLGFDQRAWGQGIGVDYGSWIWYTGRRDEAMVRDTLQVLRGFAKAANITSDTRINAEKSCLQLLAKLQAANPPEGYISTASSVVRAAWSVRDPWALPRIYYGGDHSDVGTLVKEELAKLNFATLERLGLGPPTMFRYKFSSVADLSVSDAHASAATQGRSTPTNTLDSFAISGSVIIGAEAEKGKPSASPPTTGSLSGSGVLPGTRRGTGSLPGNGTSGWKPFARDGKSGWSPYSAGNPSGWSPVAVSKDNSFLNPMQQSYMESHEAESETDLIQPLRAKMARSATKGDRPKNPVSAILWVARDLVLSMPAVINDSIDPRYQSKPFVCWKSETKAFGAKGGGYYETKFDSVPMGVMLIAEITFSDGSIEASIVPDHTRLQSFVFTAFKKRFVRGEH